eukprot:scaffold185962_cov32-Tisochrysis_lutea.AAC.1
MAGLHLINDRFLQPNRLLGLDDAWDRKNGMRDLHAKVLQQSISPLASMMDGEICLPKFEEAATSAFYIAEALASIRRSSKFGSRQEDIERDMYVHLVIELS